METLERGDCSGKFPGNVRKLAVEGLDTSVGRPELGCRVVLLRGRLDEANPPEGTLSYVSPLAQAMMDNGRGDVVQVGSLKGDSQ
jgi:hypothetical protein